MECTSTTSIIKDHDDKMLLILDGFDESKDIGQNVQIRCTDPDENVSSDTIIFNILQGEFLPRSRVLLTSRPHGAEAMLDTKHRTVELV